MFENSSGGSLYWRVLVVINVISMVLMVIKTTWWVLTEIPFGSPFFKGRVEGGCRSFPSKLLFL